MMSENHLEVRLAVSEDWQGIWEIFRQVVASGQTYVYDPATTSDQAQKLWLNPTAEARTYVMLDKRKTVGTYLLKPNQIGLGNHVANAGFMIHPDTQGQGFGKLLAEHCLDQACELGYKAMQFNFVIATNHGAIHLWEKLGFEIVGTLPKVYRHAQQGLVDAYVMHRFL